jgi:hypothetical protein
MMHANFIKAPRCRCGCNASEGVKTEVYKQRTKESNYVVWQKQLNQGSRTETMTLPSFTGTVNTPFNASRGHQRADPGR